MAGWWWPELGAGTVLWSASLRVLPLALAAALVAWLLRRRGAEARHAVWTAVLAAMLLLPVLPVVLPPLRVLPARWAPGLEAQDLPVVTNHIVLNVDGTGRVSQQGWPAPWRPSWSWLFWFIYGAVAALSGGRVAAAVWRGRGLVRRSHELRDERLSELVRALCVEQGLGYPPPRVAESGEAVVPFTAGWQDPVIVLTRDWRAWPEDKLRAVLAHEMAHVRRSDWLVAVVAAANRSLFWFHPLAWWLERHLASLAEEASDAAGIAGTGDARRYAEVVLDFASAMAGRREPVSWLATAMARSSKVGGRIERILEGKVMGWQSTSRGLWLALSMIALPLVYGAAVLQVQEPQAAVAPQQARPTAMPFKGSDLDAAGAQAVKARVAANPEDLEARVELLGYSFTNRRLDEYARQVFWLVEHHPESEVLERPIAWFALASEGIRDEATRERLLALWRQKAAENPSDANILAHAARWMMGSDPSAALDLVRQARLADAGNERVWLLAGSMYTMGAMQRFMGAPDERSREFSERAVQDLETTTDTHLLVEVGRRLASVRVPVAPASPDPQMEEVRLRAERFHTTGLHYLDRAIQLDPSNAEYRNLRQSLSEMKRMEQGQIAPLTVVRSRAPEYPPLARQARIEGLVNVAVRVDAEGHVTSAVAQDGHPLLRAAAEQCVMQWQYAPQRVNGQPVAGETTTVVNFTLPPDGATRENAATEVPRRIRVGGNVQEAQLVSAPAPEYPPLAQQARIQGTVRFAVVISPQGKVASMTVVSGHPLLVQAGQQAVAKYVYRPTLLNGEPVEVATQVDVPFTLSR